MWHEMAAQSLVPTLARSDHEADFRAVYGLSLPRRTPLVVRTVTRS
ncbi:hypothetical protein FHS44_001873 [Streptosporangium saharense]|uniref:Uncharacterized protein n=1 Tax=Streptosporangium saharense TaxID=1706840 RepID=A0A7W7VLN6_9ACTN|nr:hypothetical protein [Streptosporangium saharense]